jgi:hypothetical protein
MISKSIGMALFSGLMVSVAAWSTACGGGTVAVGTGGSTSSSTHSSTSTTTSSTTSTSSSSTSTTSSGSPGLACGTMTCVSDNVLGAVTLAPCCPTDANTCGLDLTPVAQFLPFTATCMELMRPGVVDTACPSQLLSIMGNMTTLPGCCAATNVCGAVADFSTLAPGLDFGCADTSGFADAGPPQSCTQDGGTSSGSDGGSDAAADGG